MVPHINCFKQSRCLDVIQPGFFYDNIQLNDNDLTSTKKAILEEGKNNKKKGKQFLQMKESFSLK
jgi:hypothetical protein